MQTIWNDLLHLFFPNLCLTCRTPLIKTEKQICLGCLYDLPYTHFHTQPGNPVFHLFYGRIRIQAASAFLHYEKGNKVQKLVHAFKYHGNKELAYELGKLCWQEVSRSSLFRDIDLIVPVPIHKKRRSIRGYNQAEYIARGIRAVSGLPVSTNLLYREVQSTSQVTKNIYDRWNNMQGLFTLKNESSIRGKHILLVDDVVTPSSTLCACAEKLLSVKEVQVSILTIAKAGTVFPFTHAKPDAPLAPADRNH